jgi:lipopolysaccharide biosynthesis glycosyltransferase
MFRKILNEGQAGNNVDFLLRAVKKENIERDMVTTKLSLIMSHKKFKCVYYAQVIIKFYVNQKILFVDIVYNLLPKIPKTFDKSKLNIDYTKGAGKALDSSLAKFQ